MNFDILSPIQHQILEIKNIFQKSNFLNRLYPRKLRDTETPILPHSYDHSLIFDGKLIDPSITGHNLDNPPPGFELGKTWIIETPHPERDSRPIEARFLVLKKDTPNFETESTVYKAWDLALERYVAIKSKPSTSSIIHEVKMHAKFNHPSIPELFDVFDATTPASPNKKISLFSFQWIEGKNGYDLIESKSDKKRFKPMDPAQLIEIADSIGGAIAHCHEQGIILRDIKPDNILFRARDNKPFLTDFGIALSMNDLKKYKPDPDQYAGTSGYMDDDILDGNPPAITSDEYAFAITMYRFLTGKLPYGDNDFPAKISNNPLLTQSFGEKCTQELDKVFLRALASKRSDRYQTISNFTQDFINAISLADNFK